MLLCDQPAKALEVVPQSMEELSCQFHFCSGPECLLPTLWAQGPGPESTSPCQLLLRALSGLGQLFFTGLYTDYLLPDGNPSFLQHLFFFGPLPGWEHGVLVASQSMAAEGQVQLPSECGGAG